ncbi:glycoside hydrolase family 2 protein [Stipitochalara longipes BDJ]|nr:glycoside hydrolase family 2 protein [Stipitochalara longipes BDJ]
MPSQQREVVQLDHGWLFKQQEGSTSARTFRQTAMFPTNIHLDLLANNLIPDPFIGTNEEEVQWIGDQTWVYRCSFTLPAHEVNKFQHASMIFEGLDTFCVVKLDGKEVLSSNNMFISYRVDVRDLVKIKQEHILELVFQSATEKGQLEMKQHPEHAWGTWNGDPSRAAVRKAQYHYGWDWGPKLMTCGPWKPVYLELYNGRISDLSFSTTLSDDLDIAEIIVSAEIEGSVGAVKFELSLDGQNLESATVRCEHRITKTVFTVRNPELWWPFTHGNQPLYTLKASLLEAIDATTRTALDATSKRFGIRKIELIQRPLLEEDGTTFFFSINNTPIFITGACWIPADSFTSRITPSKYRDWISLSKTANQSMLRVWGGGIYEPDLFYDICDELGVLVWQDFMFACGNYPAYPEMLRSIELEARQNVSRLRHHPCVVIWAGNNEDYLYQALAGLEYDADDNDPENWLKSNFPARYIYEHLLRKVVEEVMPGTPYHPGSPFGGIVALDPEIGDIHQWSVWHMDQQPYQNYDQLGGRFVSEFGMQGLPVKRTVEEYFENGVNESEKTVGNKAIEWHNKATGGSDTLQKYLDYNLLAPTSTSTLEDHIYSTQLIQSEALATAYRSWKRQWKGPGRELCGGLLVWQLNDCWPVTSWSIADYHLRPKMVFWAIKRESQQITTGLKRTSKGWEAWGVNLSLESLVVDVQVKIWSVKTGVLVFEQVLLTDFLLPANCCTEFPGFEVPGAETSKSKEMVAAIYLVQRTSALARHVNFHEPLKEVPFEHPAKLTAKICANEKERWLELHSQIPVKGVLVEVQGNGADEIVWDENGVDLVPRETMRLPVKGLQIGDERRLSIKWLGGKMYNLQ